MRRRLGIGEPLPLFILKDQNNQFFDLKDHIGKYNLIIYFYPKNETPGCIAEACSFRDAMGDFLEYDCKVIGISSDSPSSHLKFSQHYNLPFTLLSDSDQVVRKRFGVPSGLLGLLPGRSTYVANKTGSVVMVFHHQWLARKHVKIALEALKISEP